MPVPFAIAEMPPLFALLAIILLAVVLVSLLFLRVKQSLLVAYFLCGILIANSGIMAALGGAQSEGGLQQMAEFGVILLLFTLGLEFSLSDLKHVRRWAFLGGGAQVLLCFAAGYGLSVLAGLPTAPALLLGAALALSSTAICVKVFQDMGLAARSGARFALAVAIFQDLFIIAFLLLLPLLTSTEGQSAWWEQLGALAGKGSVFLLSAWALARYIFPWLLHTVTRSRSRELFTLTVYGLCVGVAFLGALLDLSLALGAFVAGLCLSETLYKHRILAEAQPVKDLFLTLFFVSVGLLIQVDTVLAHWLSILGLTALLMLGKTLLILAIARGLGLRWQSALLAALSLSSAGEFSVVLLPRVGAIHPLSAATEQILLASAALSMGLVPVLMMGGARLGAALQKRLPAPPVPAVAVTPVDRKKIKTLTDHAIICGYGTVGQQLCAALEGAGVPVLIIELNADTVRTLHRTGHLAIFADVTHGETWALARVAYARLVAFTFPHTESTLAAYPLVREQNTAATLLARTKFRAEAKKLEAVGINLVIHDEHESAQAMIRDALSTSQG